MNGFAAEMSAVRLQQNAIRAHSLLKHVTWPLPGPELNGEDNRPQNNPLIGKESVPGGQWGICCLGNQ